MDNDPQLKSLLEINAEKRDNLAMFVALASAGATGLYAFYNYVATQLANPNVQNSIQQAVQGAQNLK